MRVLLTASGGEPSCVVGVCVCPPASGGEPSCVVRVCVCPPAMKHKFSCLIAFHTDVLKEMSTLSALRLVLNIIISADLSQRQKFSLLSSSLSLVSLQKPLDGGVTGVICCSMKRF